MYGIKKDEPNGSLKRDMNCGMCDKRDVCKHVADVKEILRTIEDFIDGRCPPKCIHFSVNCDHYKQYFGTPGSVAIRERVDEIGRRTLEVDA